MTPHPTTETLLAEYGNTAAGRANARQALEAEMVATARQEAAKAGRSVKCFWDNHARVDPEYGRVGCANDGSTCICRCHDEDQERAGEVEQP